MHTLIQPLPKTLSRDELDALLAVPKNRRDQAYLEAMAGCGLRVSEICHLKLDQVQKLRSRTSKPSRSSTRAPVCGGGRSWCAMPWRKTPGRS